MQSEPTELLKDLELIDASKLPSILVGRMSDDGPAMPSPLINQSCQRCKAKKVRCDSNEPCSRCIRHGLGEECRRLPRKSRIRYSQPEDPTQTPLGQQQQIDDLDLLLDRQAQQIYSRGALRLDASSSNLLFTQTHDYIHRAVHLLRSSELCKKLLRSVYYWKILCFLHGSIHPPALFDILERTFQAYDDLEELQGPIPTKDEVALLLISMALSFQFTAREEPSIEPYQLLLAFGDDMSSLERQKRLGSLAFEYYTISIEASDDVQHSVELVQTAISILLFDQLIEKDREVVFHQALHNALRLNMHRITQPFHRTEEGFREEMMARCWWFLACHNWFTSVSKLFYTVHRNQMTTRMPSEDGDFTLTGKVFPERAIWTPSRYSIAVIRLAEAVRLSVDLKLAAGGKQTSWEGLGWQIDQVFSQMASLLPSSFRVDTMNNKKRPGGTELSKGASMRADVDRWFFHQHLFYVYLELQMPENSQPLPSGIVEMARNVLTMTQLSRGKCTIIDHLRFTKLAVLKATTVLAVAEMQKPYYPGNFLIRSKLLGEVETLLTDPDYEDLQTQKRYLHVLAQHLRILLSKQDNGSSIMGEDISMESPSTLHKAGHSRSTIQDDSLTTANTSPSKTSHEPTGVFSDWINSLPSENAIDPSSSSSLSDSDLGTSLLDWLSRS